MALSLPPNQSEILSHATTQLSGNGYISPKKPTLAARRKIAAQITFVYVMAAIIWLLLSDTLLPIIFPNAAFFTEYSGARFGVFILLSGGLLYRLFVRHSVALHTWESTVRTEEEKLKRIVETVANGIVMSDDDGIITHANPAFCRYLGYRPDELIGQHLDILRVDDEDALSPASILSLTRERRYWSGEVQRRAKDGTPVPLHLTVAPIYNGQKEIIGYVGDYLDLRKIKQTQSYLDGLGGVIENLSAELDFHKLCHKAIDATIGLTDATVGGVIIFEDNTQKTLSIADYHCVDNKNSIIPQSQCPIDLNSANFAQIIHQGQAVLIDDIAVTEYLNDLSPVDIKSVAAVPIFVTRKIIGMLFVAHGLHTSHFSHANLPILEAIAYQVGIAVHRQKLLDDARESENRFRDVVNTVPNILYSATLPEFKTSFLSPAVSNLLGYTPDEFEHDSQLWRRLIHPDDLEIITSQIAKKLDHEGQNEYVVEYRSFHKDGQKILWFQDRGIVKRDENNKPCSVTGVVTDITVRKEAEERLSYLAYFDGLTGLPNRLKFLKELQHLIDTCDEQSAPFAVLYFDIDRFHLFNDYLGHDVGDEILLEVTRRLQQLLQDKAIMARTGADEFLIALKPEALNEFETTHEAATYYSDQITALFNAPVRIGDQDSFVAVSIGISLHPGDAHDADTLLIHAHRALSRAKQLGHGGAQLYAGELADRQQRIFSIHAKLHNAIDNKEFVLYYQPIVELSSQQIVAAEALIRWKPAGNAMISPGEFIPIAEDTGLIVPLGDWVINEVCRQQSIWRKQGIEITVACNLSPRQFHRDDVVENIINALHTYSIPADALEVEITESAALADPEHTSRVLQKMRANGLHLSIDDFGTGYSSLDRLKRMPVHTLKIDRAFINDVSTSKVDSGIVTAIIQLSRHFQMRSLAEGIETDDQFKCLRDMGCMLGQGYFFGRPMPANEFFTLVAPKKDIISAG